MAHDVNQDKCRQHGGILPEPRSQEENQFLNNLNTEMFVLGLSDVETEGSWQWDSDRTPVVYSNWLSGDGAGGRAENCVFMSRNFRNYDGFWADFSCSSSAFMDARNKSLICQKTEGKHKCVDIF